MSLKTYKNMLEGFNGSVWAIDEAKMCEITAFVESLDPNRAIEAHKIFVDPSDDDENQPTGKYPLDGVQVHGSTAVVPIMGTIFKRANLFTNISGGTSTELLTKTVKILSEQEDIENVIFNIDSPGGQVGGLSEAAEAIRSLRESKNVTSIATGTAASAAYWLGSAANRFYAGRDALVGNIGTMMVHVSDRKRLEDAGTKYTIFRSAPLKGIGHPAEDLTDAAKSEYQRILDDLNAEFVRNVALNRNITLDKAKQMADARTHVGETALKEGFVDGIKTLDEILGELDDETTAAERLKIVTAEYESVVNELLEAKQQINALEKDLDSTKAESLKTKVDATLDELCAGENARFAPMQRDALRSRLENDFEVTMEILKLVPEGSANPNGEKIEVPEKKQSENDKIAEAKEKGIPIAEDQQAEDIYKRFDWVEGKDYIRGF